jgi:hypothetical protein
MDLPRAPMILFDDTVVDPAIMVADQMARVARAIQVRSSIGYLFTILSRSIFN